MQITLHRDVAKYVLTSAIKKEDIDLVKKYRPEALKIKDGDGNDVFGISYSAGRSSVSGVGVTFGAVNADGFAIVVGDIPERLPDGTPSAGEYVADQVGKALGNINLLEATLPEVVASIKHDRAELIGGIVNA